MPQGQPGPNTHTAAQANVSVIPYGKQATCIFVPLEQPQPKGSDNQHQQPGSTAGGLYPVSFTPSNQTECGAHMSTQPVPLQHYGGMAVGAVSGGPPDSTTSSCQPTASTEAATMSLQQGSGAPATSSCGLGQKGMAGQAGDAQSPPAPSAGGARGGGRRRVATAGKKRDRDDPLLKAVERYMAAKKEPDVAASLSQQLPRAQRPRTAPGGGKAKSASTSGTLGSAGSLPSGHEHGGAAGAVGHGNRSGLSHAVLGLQLGSPSYPAGAQQGLGAAALGLAGAAGNADLLATLDSLAEGVAGGAAAGLEGAAMQGVHMAAGQQAGAAALPGHFLGLHQQYESLAEQMVGEFGDDVGAFLMEAAALGHGGSPWAAPPLPPQAPLTHEELEEARRQLRATAQPFPVGYQWVNPMPLSAELFDPLEVPAAAAATGARDGGRLGRGGSGHGSDSNGGTRGLLGAGAGTGTARPPPSSAGRSSKLVVRPYRQVPSGGQQQPQRGHSSGAAARARYPVRAARSKRKKEAGYVSFDSEEEDAADLTDSEDEDSRPASSGARSSAKPATGPRQRLPREQQAALPAVKREQPSDAVVHLSVRSRAPGGIGRQAAKYQQMLAAAPAAAAAAAGARAARQAVAGAATPLTAGPLDGTGLSPLLSPTLASLFLPGGAGPAAPIDLNVDLEHLLGEFDFSGDMEVLGCVVKPDPSPVKANGTEVPSSAAAAAACCGNAKQHHAGAVGASSSAATATQAASASAAPPALLNPALPAAWGGKGAAAPPHPAVLRVAAAPMLPLTHAASGVRAVGASAQAAQLAQQQQEQEPASLSRAASLDPCVSIGGAIAPAAAAAAAVTAGAAGTGGEADTVAGSVLAEKLGCVGAKGSVEGLEAAAMPAGSLPGAASGDGLDLVVALGGRQTPLGSPLLQGLMSPTALGQFF
ncbi:hypothetical protein N2152v2_005160 [Parachlorella kessleri]